MNNNKELIDLCRLNLMRDNIKDSPAHDRDTTLGMIDYKCRQIVTRIEPASLAPDAIERHKKENTYEGVYPWTEHPMFTPQIIPDEQEASHEDK